MGRLSHFLCKPSLLTYQGCSRLAALLSGFSSGPLENLCVCVRVRACVCESVRVRKRWGCCPPPMPVGVLRMGHLERRADWNVELHQCLILWFKKIGTPPGNKHWTLFTLVIFLLDKLKHSWGCSFFFFPSLSFLRSVMRVALPPLFLLIGSKVINVVYSAALVCIPLDYVKRFGWIFICILPSGLGLWMFICLFSNLWHWF